ncbi:MAG: DUF697 domain-containing protein [Prolixibacteraceae bacterium]|jgi:uncharacterized protein (DUF697 family)|nr:DUF697 domain-containing protein [Prolixibacteraceae bacterium]
MEKKEVTEEVAQPKLDSANDLVKKWMWWTMGAGLIPVPFVDLAAVTGVQLKMLSDLSKLYEVKFSENRGKAIISALLGSIVPNSLAGGGVGSVLKMIPLVGTILGGVSMSLFSGAATYAIGKSFIQHFESGGTFLDFDPVKVKEYFKDLFEEGKAVAKEMENNKAKKTV